MDILQSFFLRLRVLLVTDFGAVLGVGEVIGSGEFVINFTLSSSLIGRDNENSKANIIALVQTPAARPCMEEQSTVTYVWD